MRVDPAELVGLARRSEETAADLRQRWAGAAPGREVPREAWGDHPSAAHVSATYDAAGLAAGSALSALVVALELGARALVEAADDVTAADESSAELLRVPGEQGPARGTRRSRSRQVLMPAHPWQLRCDATPLTAAAALWLDLAEGMTAAADDLVRASRRVRDHGWESGSAEVYDGHRKQVVGGLDTVAVAAREISRVLDDIAGTLSATQRRLDREWSVVAAVPHSTLGTQGVLVFQEDSDDQRGQVQRATRTAQSIRSELDTTMEGLSGRLRAAHVELRRAADSAVAGSTGSGAVGGIAGIAERISASVAEDLAASLREGSSSDVAGGLDAGAAYAGPLGTTSLTTTPSVSTPLSDVDGALAGGALAGLGLRGRRGRQVEQASPAMSPGMTTGRGGLGGRQGSRQGSGQGATRTGTGRPGAAGARATEPTRTDTETDTERAARRVREKSDVRTDHSTTSRLVAQERRAAGAARRGEGERSGGSGEATG